MALTASPDANYLVGYLFPLSLLLLWIITSLNRNEVGELIKIGSNFTQRIRSLTLSQKSK
jgi:hypothetical protein